MHYRLAASLLLLSVVLAGCASPVPEAIRASASTDLGLAEVRRADSREPGGSARWGGEIIAIHNASAHSDVEILGRPLDGEGRPDSEAQALGRFIARRQGFVDPAEFAEGTEVTVRGRLIDRAELKIGDYRYHYPVLEVEHWYRWPERIQVPPPGYRDPWFWDPWYPFHPWHRRHYGY